MALSHSATYSGVCHVPDIDRVGSGSSSLMRIPNMDYLMAYESF